MSGWQVALTLLLLAGGCWLLMSFLLPLLPLLSPRAGRAPDHTRRDDEASAPQAAAAPSAEAAASPAPARVRIAVPDFLEPMDREAHPYIYWDGSVQAAAAALALRRLPPGMRRLFEEAVEAASLTVHLSDESDIRLLAPHCFEPGRPAEPQPPIGLYLPGQCILVAVNCSQNMQGVVQARETVLHEAMHAIDDHLGTPTGLADDYASEEEDFSALADSLPAAVRESFSTWGYSDDRINREIFAEGGAAYLTHRDADPEARAWRIGTAVTRYADAPGEAAVLSAGRALDRHFSSLERVLPTQPAPKIACVTEVENG